MILIYTFYAWNNKTFKFLRQFEHPDVKPIYIHGVPSIKKLLKHIENNHYDYIIGLGDYRKTAKNIRLETIFVNRHGSKRISELSNENLYSTISFDTTGVENVVISDKPTTGPCNRSAYLVAEHIKLKKLKTKFVYIHAPRGKKIEDINITMNILINQLTFSQELKSQK